MSGFNTTDTVAQHYDDNAAFADNLNHLIPNFEYPNWSHKTIQEVLDTVSGHHIDVILTSLGGVELKTEKELEASVLANSFESRIRSEFEENHAGIEVFTSDVLGAYREMGIEPNQEIQRKALSRIESRNFAFSDAEAVAKAAKMVGISGLNARLKASREIKVDVISPEVSKMWAELDFRDFSKLNFLSDRKLDAGLIIAENMNSNMEYKLTLERKAPLVVQSIKSIDHENNLKIEAKETRKAADMFVVSRNETSGMVSLSKIGESTVIDFGGVPAILSYAQENPAVPIVVINELLARDGGYEKRIEVLGDTELFSAAKNEVIAYLSLDDMWAEAAERSIESFSFRSAKMIAESEGKGKPVEMIENIDYHRLCGPVLGVTEKHVVLDNGRSIYLFKQAGLSRVPQKEESVSIVFGDGVGKVSEKKALESGVSR